MGLRKLCTAEKYIDVIFIESPESIEELTVVAEHFPSTPVLANMIEGGRTPLLSADKPEALGYAIAIYPIGEPTTSGRAPGVWYLLVALSGSA